MPDYQDIPTAAAFQEDSSVKGQLRSQDPLLVDLDRQLAEYAAWVRSGDVAKHFHAVGELFLTANAWIAAAHGRTASTIEHEEVLVMSSGSNVVKKGLLKLLHMGNSRPKSPKMASTIVPVPTSTGGMQAPVDRGQFQAVLSLFGAIEQKLADMLGVQDRMRLKNDLVRLIGQAVNEAGQRTDKTFDTHMIASASERQIHKLFVENGLIYRYNVDVPGIPSELSLLQSSRFEGTDIMRKNPRTGVLESGLAGYAPFVMSLDRQFYMQKHSVEEGGVFHSTYLNGQPVAAAGTMLVENGMLKAIRGDSGHYKPEPRQIANALRALQQLGVSLAGVKVVHYEDADDKNDAANLVGTPLLQAPAPGAAPVPPSGDQYAQTKDVLRANAAQPYLKTPGQQPPEYLKTPYAGGYKKTPAEDGGIAANQFLQQFG